MPCRAFVWKENRPDFHYYCKTDCSYVRKLALRNFRISASKLTLGHVFDALDPAADFSATRRRDLLSDVKTVARWLDRLASSIKSDVAGLRARLAHTIY